MKHVTIISDQYISYTSTLDSWFTLEDCYNHKIPAGICHFRDTHWLTIL